MRQFFRGTSDTSAVADGFLGAIVCVIFIHTPRSTNQEATNQNERDSFPTRREYLLKKKKKDDAMLEKKKKEKKNPSSKCFPKMPSAN